MEESITQVTEKNTVIRDWSLKTQKAKGDSLTEGCISNLPEQVTTNARQNNLEDLTRIWKQWDSDTRGIFTENYEDIAHLITVNVDEQLIQAMVRFRDLAYQCFTFNQEDMTLTIEEYAALLHIDNVQFSKIYVKEPKPMTFKKKLVRLTGMTDMWAEKQIKKKNKVSCVPWFSVRDLVQNHPDIVKRMDLFALTIYGLIVFPKVLRHVEVAVVDFFERLKQGIKPLIGEKENDVLSDVRKSRAHTLPHVFKKFAPLKAYLQKDWPKNVNEQHWASVFQNLGAEEITWRAPWIRPSVLLYKCRSQDWVPLLGLWGGVGSLLHNSSYLLPEEDWHSLSLPLQSLRYCKVLEGNHLMELALYADTITQDYDI
ncbi:hypothetical protein CXB51_025311 [Gossypium anomalum]|uniref:DUF7745 domain-containing protein n=1 Tax=Gossypium anomalum TaxID=47600 RepID=A0A8J5YJX8_9ROSI|nr:hypothetical protein CXB51_025311 [Gossypium anomalum]